MKKLVIIVLIGLVTLSSIAQTAPAWKAERLGPVEWMRVTNLGYVVVSTLGSLKCIDPETGKIMWENKSLGTVREEMFAEVSGTQYLQVGYGTEEDDQDNSMIALIDCNTGNVMFDSRKERLAVIGTYPLSQSGTFMVVGVEPGKFSAKLYLYKMQDGSLLWRNDEVFKGSTGKGGLLGKMAGAVQSAINIQSLTSSPIETNDGHIYITHPSYVIKLKANDGVAVWRANIEESTQARLFYTRNKPDVVFVGAERESEPMTSASNQSTAKVYSSNYYAFDTNTGKSIWKSPVRMNNERVNLMIAGNKGVIILPGSSGTNKPDANQLDYSTGAGLWGNKGKGVKLDGTVVDHAFTEQGLVIATGRQSNFSNQDDIYALNALNLESGQLRFEKPIRLNGRLVMLEQTQKGILYQTTREVNIFNPLNGNMLLPAPIESGGPKRENKIVPFPSNERDNKLYVFATREGIIKELDENTATVKSIHSVNIELAGKELPKSIDAFDEGITLCSDQNIIMMGYDGKLKFSNYFNPPRESGLMRALALAEAVQSAYIGIALISSGASLAETGAASSDPSVKKLATGGSIFMGSLAAVSFSYTGKALADFNRRFKATTMTQDYLLVLSEVAPRDFRLLQVDKRTGKVKTTLDLGKDRNPVYAVDLVLNQVYHLSSGYEITCFKL